MRVLVIGGTRFIGAAIVEDLAVHGHEVSVFHTGRSEAADLPPVHHVHGDRHDVGALRDAIAGTRADVLVDTCAYSTADARAAIDALSSPGGSVPVVVLSSQDVYRAFATLRAVGAATDAVPLDERAALRPSEQRYLFRGERSVPAVSIDPDTYENLDVEDAYREVAATVLRLPAVYGERDYVRREESVLRRVRSGRRWIPIGAGTLLWSRGYVRDVAGAIRLAVESPAVRGETFNVAEARSWTMEQWAAKVLEAAGSDAELVRVPDAVVPADLGLTRTFPQHVLVDSTKIRASLGWTDSDPDEALRRSVGWHLDHPPADAPDDDFHDDDRALAAVP